MDVNERKMVEQMLAHNRELESWLALLIARHGDHTGAVWQYGISGEAAVLIRGALPARDMHVAVTYDMEQDTFFLSAI